MKTAASEMDKDKPLPLSALQLVAPPLRLMSAAMWKVMLQKDAIHYGKVEETVTSICETVPGLLHYRHQARLTMGLRALMILEELRQSDPPDTENVLQELNKLQTSSVSNGKKKDKKVEEAKYNFKTLVHSLLKNASARKQFFKEEFHLHYGKNYLASLEKLMWEFLMRLDQLLPVPDLAQTVSWLSAAPAVLEECARSASQPQLLRTLLQHEKCLGHLGSSSLLSSTGDGILSSLSLPLSGRVLQTIQSESTPTNPKSHPSMTRTTRRTSKETQSQVTPVIGSISTVDLKISNDKVATNSGPEAESASETSRNTRSKLRSCSKKTVPEKEKMYYVEDVLVTVISQSSGSEVEEEEQEEGGKEETSSAENSRLNKPSIKYSKRASVRDVSRECLTETNSKVVKSLDKADLNELLISCMKRNLRVVIPRLKISNNALPVQLNRLPEQKESTSSPCQPYSKDSVQRKRRFTDLSPTPEKHLTLSADGLTPTCSPCIPLLKRFPVSTPETPSSLANSSDDIICDSDDERTDTVKRKVFNQQYCKTSNGTYVPTLREFWNPMLCTTSSPGSRH